METSKTIRTFIEKNLIVFEDEVEFEDGDNIFEMGFVNSLFAMRLLKYIESEFGITVANEDMEIENFSSVNRIVDFIGRAS